MIQAIREFFYKRSLVGQKRRALYEVRQDLRFIEICKSEMLKYDESKARKRMAELKQKENRTDKEDAELDAILDVISVSKATKNEYEQSKRLEKSLEEYLSILY